MRIVNFKIWPIQVVFRMVFFMFLGIYARTMFWFFINDLLYYVQLYKNLAFENEFNKSDVWYHVLINEVQDF